jgi:polysaccharide deacetylase family protein (PEP-CTERM system associated)
MIARIDPQRLASGAQASAPAPIANAMSIDVEDWFQVAAFDRHIDRSQWDSLECRVERNLERILALLDRHDAKATFFTLGWIAERYPAIIRAIVAGGHELASHGYGHQRVSELTPEGFREDLMRARVALEDIGGVAVHGYRAPSFSIGRDNLWAHDVLAETGHRYSSSVYPIAHDHYGMPEAPRFAWRTQAGIVEIPPSSLRMMGRNLPASGGGYFRLLPYSVSRWSLRRINRLDGQPAIFYFHPWEVDPEQPRVAHAGAKSKFRHYLNLHRTEQRLARLLNDFRWQRVDQVFAEHIET